MTFKKISGWLHLWLGLASGLVILIVALTGAIYEFQPEISKLTQPYLSVKAENKPFLPVSIFKDIAEKQLPGKKALGVQVRGADESVMVQFFARKPVQYYFLVYLNPYTGEVLKVKNGNNDFFRFILRGHLYLWLPEVVGHIIMMYGTLIFLFILITGIVLWWPRNKARLKNSFKIKMGTSPKRLNYDLHNVLGFYASWVIIFAVLTGLVWTFDWAAKSESFMLGGGWKKQKMLPPKSIKIAERDPNVLNKVAATITAAYPNAKKYQIGFPATDSVAITARVYADAETFYRSDFLYFDQYTAKEIPVKFGNKYAKATAAEKALRMNYDIHVGAIAGFPGRLLMFFAALISASLPITGFYIWWGKKKKGGKKKKSKTLKGAIANNKDSVLGNRK